ncbi:MAG: HD-GYP domain-containing protein [Treponema sp.]|jgi:HD-GYP domain-containing protein (c-di-GMP phosphodiesterase class II)|nr:HD-GYP domain-containing protein [Treponema sp.]
MNSFPVTTLKENTFFTQELVLDKQFILLNPTCPFNNALKKALLEWDFKVVYSDGSIGSGAVASPTPQDFEQVAIEQVDPNANDPKKPEMGDNVKKALEEAHQDLANNEKSRMSVVQTVYNEYMNYITAVYTHYATHKVLDYQELSNTVKDLCIFIKDNRRYVLRITPTLEAANKNFIVSHSMRSTVTAIVIGLQLRMPLTKLIELGVTCILHEIGQIRLPPQLYMTGKRLSAPERAKLATHPVISFNIVKENDFPLAVQLGVLEHHERENGTGYPRKLTGNKISLYAKIIAVACSFEAITAPRMFKEARSTYDAMIEVLKNEGKQFDDTVIKALLYSLSLFPIGAYVYLQNGKIAQVTDVNPTDPRNPVVQILGETDETGGPKTVQTDNGTMRIVRVLNKSEAADILKQFNINK